MSQFPDHLADRFRRFKFRHFAPNQDQYEKLAQSGQTPDVMIVSCCDSRVDPETIFSAGRERRGRVSPHCARGSLRSSAPTSSAAPRRSSR